MDPLTNRKLHALANAVAPGEAHEFLRSAAAEKFGVSYKDLTSTQCQALSMHLRDIRRNVRTNIYKALHGAEGEPITDAQISQTIQFQKLLGWSDHYLWKMVNDRYNETSLEAMPKWKAVRLVAYMQKRWHTKMNKERTSQGA